MALAGTVESTEERLMSAEDLRVQIPLFHSVDAGPGAVASMLLRRIAYRAGAYAPGIQEHLFFELTAARDGQALGPVAAWFARNNTRLHQMGYRLHCRQAAEPPQHVSDWVKAGQGHRAAVFAVPWQPFHAQVKGNATVSHAFALGMWATRPVSGNAPQLLAFDPWPGVGNPDQFVVAPPFMSTLESASRQAKYASLIFYWTGWA